MRDLSHMLLWPLYKVAGETPKTGIIAEPAFRLALLIAATALLVLAASLFLRQVKWEESYRKKLTILSAASGGAAVLSIMVGLLVR